MSYGPYVPTARLCQILQDYMDGLGITKDELASELASATGKTKESWDRRLYAWFSGESATCRFDSADEVLTNLYLIERWVTDLDDIYALAA